MSDLTLVQNNSTLILFTLVLSVVFIIAPLNLGKSLSAICKLGIIGLLCLILYNNYNIFLNNKNDKDNKSTLTEITLDCILSFSVVILILVICRILF